MPRNATIRDIARLAGVSVCTASYALRDDPRVLPATRDKVKKVAASLDYRVSTPVSNWMRQMRSGSAEIERETLAFVITKHQFESNGAARLYFAGGQERAKEHGYKLEKFVYEDGEMSERRVSDILKNRGIRGLVIGPLREKSTHFDLDWSAFAAAGFNLFWWKPFIPRVANDEYTTVHLAVKKARELGYARVGMAIFSGLDARFLHSMTAAYMRTCELLEGMVGVPAFLGDKHEFNQKNFERWFLEHKPDCLLGARCLLPFLDEMNVRVPEVVGYISLNKGGATRDCAGYSHDLKLIGATAVDQVVAQLNRNHFGVPEIPVTTLVGSTWSDGPTIRQNRNQAAEPRESL